MLKAVMFQSFEIAYYTGFITVKFIPQDLLIYFDPFTLQAFTLFLWVNAVTILATQYIQMRYIEMQFNAQLLGKWSYVNTASNAVGAGGVDNGSSGV